MEKLLESIAVAVSLLPSDKIEAIALHLQKDGDLKPTKILAGSPIAQAAIDQLVKSLGGCEVSNAELSSMLLAANYTYQKIRTSQSVELVWTGPKTPFVSPRRTEQSLLEVVNSAEKTLFIVSFVAYEIPSIMKALAEAIERKVDIFILLELSRDHGGSIDIDVLGKMKNAIPSAKFYIWKEKGEGFDDGRVHAKVALSDKNKCFITSANLTGYAMERNMELGVLISGGEIPILLYDHLNALVDTKVISIF